MSIEQRYFKYKLKIGKRAQKALSKLDFPTQNKILKTLKKLTTDTKSLNIKKLENYDNFYRIHCGNYRIIYEPQHNVITIYVIYAGHRKNIYQEFKKFIKQSLR